MLADLCPKRAASYCRVAHPEVGTEDMWEAAGHLKNTLHTLTKQIWGVYVLQDGLQIAHHQLKPTQQIHPVKPEKVLETRAGESS